MRVRFRIQFLGLPNTAPRKGWAIHIKVPVVHITRINPKEGTQHYVRCCKLQHRKNAKCTLVRASKRKRRPTLPWSKNGTSIRGVIHVLLRVQTRRCIVWVVQRPATASLEYVTEDAPKAFVLPALDRTSIDMGTKGKFGISGLTNAQSVKVRDRR